jgi:hypothetical protein
MNDLGSWFQANRETGILRFSKTGIGMRERITMNGRGVVTIPATAEHSGSRVARS